MHVCTINLHSIDPNRGKNKNGTFYASWISACLQNFQMSSSGNLNHKSVYRVLLIIAKDIVCDNKYADLFESFENNEPLISVKFLGLA